MEDSGFDDEIPEELKSWFENLEDENEFFRGQFILVNGKIKKATLFEWAKWHGNPDNRRIELTMIGDIRISTVFLGLDHGMHFTNKIPVLFETMVFGGELDSFQWRYCTYGDAKRGHYEIVNAIKENRDPDIDVGEKGFWMWFKEMFEEPFNDFDDSI